MDKQKLNNKLLEACISEKIDLIHIEELLKLGANPLGRVEDRGDNNLYDVVLFHFLDLANYENADDSDFLKITELFIKYGMDILNPEVPYDDGNVINPLWSFAFYDTEAALQSLKLLLDNGLDVESAGLCWSHDLSDLWLADFEIEDERDGCVATHTFRKVMLFASYPHIINVDESLQNAICYNENSYDITNFKDWKKFKYLIEPTDRKRLNKSVVRIFEKDTNREVWKFVF